MPKKGDFKPLSERYEVADNGCWLWTSTKNTGGYGFFQVNDRNISAHRYFFEFYHSIRIPAGMVIDHLCGRPSCVNPSHLEVVSPRENALRYTSKKTE